MSDTKKENCDYEESKCNEKLLKAATQAIKKSISVKPEENGGSFSCKCGAALLPQYSFCWNCGQAIKWENNNQKKRQKEVASMNLSSDILQVMEEWNSLSDIGIAPIKDIKAPSRRFQLTNGRIREHGLETVIATIRSIRESDFLQGQNPTGWTITYDWIILPKNFRKVLDGNYKNNTEKKKKNYMEKVEHRVSEVDNWV